MRESLITTSGVALKQQPIEDLSHFFKRRLRAELSNGKRVRSFCQLIDLIVIRQFKSDFHLMHRNSTLVPKAPLPINDQTLIRPLNVVVGRLVIKCSVGQVNSLIKKFLCDFFSHRRMMQRVHGWINPKFSRVNILSHAANVAPGYANKNVRGAAI